MKKFEHKKSLGQNFLKNDAIIDRIIMESGVGAEDFVIEIGPGQGVLTEKLSQKVKKVIAIELDDRLIDGLRGRFSQRGNVDIVQGNILHMNISELLSKYDADQYKVVANIPYYITAPIIRLLLENKHQPKEIVLMVQKEVAERVTANPGDMSVLAVSAQYYADVKYLFTVSRDEFDPVPAVDSAIIQLNVKNKKTELDKSFFRVVKVGFSAKRKTLVNNLANGFHKEKKEIEQILEKCNLHQNVRAQELSLDQWMQLEKVLRNK